MFTYIIYVYIDGLCFRWDAEAGSDFFTNSYGESLDSSCQKIMSSSAEPMSPSSISKESQIESAL